MKRFLLKTCLRFDLGVRSIIMNTLYSTLYILYPKKRKDTYREVLKAIEEVNDLWEDRYISFNIDEDIRTYYRGGFIKFFNKYYVFVKLL